MSIRVADYSCYQAEGGQGDWDSGILKIELDSWDEFHIETAKLLDIGDFIWRGQSCDWPLKSKFDRIIDTNRQERLEEHKNAFLRAIKGRRGNNPPQLKKPDEIWSLGQHHGLATPFIDWTKSPFVGAYFAFQEKNTQNENDIDSPNRFIYALSKDIRRWGPSKSKGSHPYDRFIKFVEPSSDENPRILSQRGLFTISRDEEIEREIDIEERVRRCYKDDPQKNQKRIIFVKIKIPEPEREKCLRNLNRMNINHATLFPDLIGAADYCNLKLEIENYS